VIKDIEAKMKKKQECCANASTDAARSTTREVKVNTPLLSRTGKEKMLPERTISSLHRRGGKQ